MLQAAKLLPPWLQLGLQFVRAEQLLRPAHLLRTDQLLRPRGKLLCTGRSLVLRSRRWRSCSRTGNGSSAAG